MTDTRIDTGGYGAPDQKPEDFDPQCLPQWINKQWWQTGSGNRCGSGWWAALDLRLAFPSVKLGRLQDTLRALLGENAAFEPLPTWMGGYPEPVLSALNQPSARLQVADNLVEALRQVKVDSGSKIDSIPETAWRPHHARADLPPKNPGLPTGLAISGLLLNAALAPADRKIFDCLTKTRGKHRGAFLRFADDMTVRCRSRSGLFALIEKIGAAISGLEDGSHPGCLATAPSDSNLYLNLAKFEPEPVREAVRAYLEDQGWKPCRQCEELVPPADPANRSPQGLVAWWQDKQGKADDADLRRLVRRAAVTRGEVDPFVTSLVERMSKEAKDTLADRFGEGAKDRLERLHDLARLDIVDEQVRPDTRRTFAANRLVRAWLPGDREETWRSLLDIWESVNTVLRKTPWKFALWRAVVRAAARRPYEGAVPTNDEDAKNDQGKATKWLSRQLGRIACQGSKERRPESWIEDWPEDPAKQFHREEGDSAWQDLHLSYHRSFFWRELAETIRLLLSHHDRCTDPRPDDPGHPSWHWSVRAVPEGRHAEVAKFLADLDRWIKILYPANAHQDAEPAGLPNRPWELDHLVAAALAGHSRSAIAEALQRCQPFEDSEDSALFVPESLLPNRDSPAVKLLDRCGRIQPLADPPSHRPLEEQELALVRLGARDRKLGKTLFPSVQPGSGPAQNLDRERLRAIGVALGCAARLDPGSASDQALAAKRHPIRLPAATCKDPLALRDYSRWRMLRLGLKRQSGGSLTLHNLLWGATSNSAAGGAWDIRPWEAPIVGLPARVSVYFFLEARKTQLPRQWTSEDGPLVWALQANDDALRMLRTGRRIQLGLEEESQGDADTEPSIERSTEWEIPPHPAYFLPFAAAKPPAVNKDAYALYCDTLLLLTALDGGEQILDRLAESGAGAVPFEDRWAWRSRIHLSVDAWKDIEAVIRWSEHPAGSPGRRATEPPAAPFRQSLGAWRPQALRMADFLCERVDIRLETRRDEESVRAVQPAAFKQGTLPDHLRLVEKHLHRTIVVRIAQIAAWTRRSSVKNRFPRVSAHETGTIMQQVARAFQAPSRSPKGVDPQVVLLPELSIPQPEISTVRDLARETGLASLSGLYWRAARPAYPAHRATEAGRRWIINEAELAVPLGFDDPGPTSLRWYRVRKPVPAHIEHGLAKALRPQSGSPAWQVLAGRRWYRFLHPHWGDFAIAICADLLDPAPWRSLRGELLHLFLVAFNRDVELYESLTWSRAYENYVNLVSVNHGTYGGSFLWTPQRSYNRELAKLRGRELFLLADVEIPVRSLHEQQRSGAESAVDAAAATWSQTKERSRSKFKAPPPGFRRR